MKGFRRLTSLGLLAVLCAVTGLWATTTAFYVEINNLSYALSVGFFTTGIVSGVALAALWGCVLPLRSFDRPIHRYAVGLFVLLVATIAILMGPPVRALALTLNILEVFASGGNVVSPVFESSAGSAYAALNEFCEQDAACARSAAIRAEQVGTGVAAAWVTAWAISVAISLMLALATSRVVSAATKLPSTLSALVGRGFGHHASRRTLAILGVGALIAAVLGFAIENQTWGGSFPSWLAQAADWDDGLPSPLLWSMVGMIVSGAVVWILSNRQKP